MKKKFAHLGKVLTREEAKMIVGGNIPPDDGSFCTESCPGGLTTCTSSRLVCDHDRDNTPRKWISCDQIKINC